MVIKEEAKIAVKVANHLTSIADAVIFSVGILNFNKLMAKLDMVYFVLNFKKVIVEMRFDFFKEEIISQEVII